MSSSNAASTFRQWFPLWKAAVCLTVLLVCVGCPPTPVNPDPVDPDPVDPDPVEVTGEIVSIKSNTILSAQEGTIDIFYNVTGSPDQIEAFYRPINPADGTGIGDDVVIDNSTCQEDAACEDGRCQQCTTNDDCPTTGTFACVAHQCAPTCTLDADCIGANARCESGICTECSTTDASRACADGFTCLQGQCIEPCVSAGESQSFPFQFDEDTMDFGSYRVGLKISGVDNAVLSQGQIRIEGPPNPMFLQPAAQTTIAEIGESISVRFDVGDPENNAQWRLFILRDTDMDDLASDSGVEPDEYGTQLTTGRNNAGVYTLETAGLPAGDYRLGLSATDSGDSISTTVANGNLDRIITLPEYNEIEQSTPLIRVVEPSPEPQPPTIGFSTPTTDVSLFRDESYLLAFAGSVFEEGAVGEITLFYDTDTNDTNGFSLIATVPSSVTTYPFPSAEILEAIEAAGLDEATYNIGARITDGINPDEVTAYASGTITVVANGTITVTEPSADKQLAPSTATDLNTVSVEWTSTIPDSVADIDVYARSLDANGSPFGVEIPVLAAGATTVTSANFSSQTSGLFKIYVRAMFNNGTSPIVVAAPGLVRVSSLPRVLWLGSLADENPPFEGAIFQGVNFEDNAGSAFAAAGDLDSDGNDDFIIAARYGKPFFVNPSGVGPGEAYIVYGNDGNDKLTGEYNLNSVGTSILRGVTLTGVRTVGDSDATDGLSDVTTIPDADGDLMSDFVFGFPNTDSAGGTYSLLESAGQFLSGGVVILSSDNGILLDPTSGTSVINLGAVGQTFSESTVDPSTVDSVATDALSLDPEQGCISGSDGYNDTVIGPAWGFISQLAPPLYAIYGQPSVLAPCAIEFSSGNCDAGGVRVFSRLVPGSGFHPIDAVAQEPFGARIIGESVGDGFGTSVTFSNSLGNENSPGDLIISAPNRSAQAAKVDGITTNIAQSGIAYLTNNRSFWGADDVFGSGDTPPTPHQYVIDTVSHCGNQRNSYVNALRIAGDSGDSIETMRGIDDFNGDGRNDFAVGAPNANGGQGRVYIAYRRSESIEGDFVLPKLELSPNNSERLTGVLITATGTDQLGTSLATGVDFNADGIKDLVIGSPNTNGGQGSVVVVFGDPNLQSPQDGISVAELLSTRNAQGQPRAARITGTASALAANSQFGFNVANAGDIDGDGFNDLLIAAPNDTPRFDSTPSDTDDELNTAGVDVDFDGTKDDVSGPLGIPDGVIDSFDNLTNAGVVYVIMGSNRLDQIPESDITISIDELGGNFLRGFLVAGRRGTMASNSHKGDRLGGGDAGDITIGGILGKLDRGRSAGLGTAGDVDGDGRDDFLIGAVLADPRFDPSGGSQGSTGVQNGGEAYLIYGTAAP